MHVNAFGGIGGWNALQRVVVGIIGGDDGAYVFDAGDIGCCLYAYLCSGGPCFVVDFRFGYELEVAAGCRLGELGNLHGSSVLELAACYRFSPCLAVGAQVNLISFNHAVLTSIGAGGAPTWGE